MFDKSSLKGMTESKGYNSESLARTIALWSDRAIASPEFYNLSTSIPFPIKHNALLRGEQRNTEATAYHRKH